MNIGHEVVVVENVRFENNNNNKKSEKKGFFVLWTEEQVKVTVPISDQKLMTIIFDEKSFCNMI